MRILLLGSNGFIGKNFMNFLGSIPEFQTRQSFVIPIDITHSIKYDLSDKFLVNKLKNTSEIDVVIHLAHMWSFDIQKSQQLNKINTKTDENVLRLVNHLKPKHFIFMSSQVNDYEFPFDHPYKKMKQQSEKMIYRFIETPFSIVRLCGVYDRDYCLLPPLASMILRFSQPHQIFLPKNPKSDYFLACSSLTLNKNLFELIQSKPTNGIVRFPAEKVYSEEIYQYIKKLNSLPSFYFRIPHRLSKIGYSLESKLFNVYERDWMIDFAFCATMENSFVKSSDDDIFNDLNKMISKRNAMGRIWDDMQWQRLNL